MAQETGERRESTAPSLAEMRAQLELLAREIDREVHILQREPEVLASHLHNMLYLDEGEDGHAGPLLTRAREALAGRPWLRLTNRAPLPSGRKALLRVLEHGAPVKAIAWLPDGRTVASADDDLIIRLWDAITGRPLAALAYEPKRESSLFAGLEQKPRGARMSWSPDGRIVARAEVVDFGVHQDFYILLWDLASAQRRATLKWDARDDVARLIWAHGGDVLCTVSQRGSIGLWDPATGEPLDNLSLPHSRLITALAWSSDDRFLAAGFDDGVVGLGNTREKTWLVEKAHTGGVSSVDWSPGEKTLASLGKDGVLLLWDMEKGRQLPVEANGVASLAWSPDARTLAGWAEGEPSKPDPWVRLWDSTTGDLRYLYGVDHRDRLRALTWSPDGNTLAFAHEDGTIYVHDHAAWLSPRSYRSHGRSYDVTIRVLEGHQGVRVLAWSPDGLTLASGSYDGTVRLWDPSRASDREEYEGPKRKPSIWVRLGLSDRAGGDPRDWPAWALAWSPDGRTLASSGGDCVVRLWDAQTGAETDHLVTDHHRHGHGIDTLAWAFDDLLLASGDRAGRICLWDVPKRKIQTAIPALFHTVETRQGVADMKYSVDALAWSPDGRSLACAGDHRVRLWDRRRRAWAFLEGWAGDVDVLAWSPSGRSLASAEPVRLWDMNEGRLVRTLERDTVEVGSLAWSTDGRTLGVGRDDGTIRLWDPDAGRALPTLAGHTASVKALAWSPDGTLLSSGSADLTVRLWASLNGECLVVAHCLSPVLALQFSADGYILRAADNGAATGNRPIPYLFEFCNIEIGPSVAPVAS